MAKQTTTRKPAGRAAAASAERAGAAATDSTVTTRAGRATPTYDAKAAKAATIAERKARLAGKEVATTEHTVAPGKFVRSGGQRYGEGETVHLSAADSERLIAKGAVLKGQAGAKAVAESADTAAAAEAEAAKVAEAQRLADEQAAKDKEAADLAAGKMSGAENR